MSNKRIRKKALATTTAGAGRIELRRHAPHIGHPSDIVVHWVWVRANPVGAVPYPLEVVAVERTVRCPVPLLRRWLRAVVRARFRGVAVPGRVEVRVLRWLARRRA